MGRSDKNLYISDMKETVYNYHANFGGVHYCTPNWEWDTEKIFWEDYNLWVVFGGLGLLHAPQKVYDLKPGSCFVLRWTERYFGKLLKSDPLRVIAIHFDFRDQRGRVVHPKGKALPPFHREVKNVSFLKTLMERSLACQQAGKPRAADRWLKASLMEVGFQDGNLSSGKMDPLLKNRMDVLCAKILEQPQKPWSIREMAKQLFYSPDHFTRLFKKHLGETPMAFIVNARIEAAKSQLLLTSFSVEHISDTLGFCDVFFFSKQFKEKTGQSPALFRRMLGKRV